HSFRLIIGADNWADFGRWKNPDLIRERFGLIVYPRPGERLAAPPHGVTMLDDAPQMDVSSTEIRNLLKSVVSDNGHRTTNNLPFLPPKVLDYIHSHHLYES
ncbi:MAG: hypothetical protein K2K97_11560, partial [Muribaculaceae bacterium]|nr:hypothetical protein [Muribaculaceae bacterium]